MQSWRKNDSARGLRFADCDFRVMRTGLPQAESPAAGGRVAPDNPSGKKAGLSERVNVDY
ncbi:hypothetical protein X743_07325 [Mesorhizobium sp. LNHC252B00]|nr:hypothetical protein X743_07325 [Mesorhizobium sp. LNHC252B00]